MERIRERVFDGEPNKVLIMKEIKRSTDVVCPVIYQGREFYGIEEFDCVVVDLFTEETHQGGYMTCIPISPKKYRKTSITKARVEIDNEDDWTVFHIYCDWGNLHTMKIHNSLSEEISYATKKAKDYDLLRDD